MISLFDTLVAQCNKKTTSDNFFDPGNFLTHRDVNTIMVTNIFNFDIKRTTHSGDNCLELACQANVNLMVIKYLVEECEMNVNHVNLYDDNCLIAACKCKCNQGSANLAVIKYLVEECKMNLEHVNSSGDNCLTVACRENINLQVIKYLIEECKMDPGNSNYIEYGDENCLSLACWGNTNLEIIKYLIEACKMDFNHINYYNENCLEIACHFNTNLAIIKYLTEDCKMDFQGQGQGLDRNDQNYINCLEKACHGNNNLAVIKYLVEESELKIRNIRSMQYDKFEAVVLVIAEKYRDLNNLLLTGYRNYEDHKMKCTIEQINPLLLNDQVRKKAEIQNPYEYKFKNFAQLVNELSCSLELTYGDE
jgi:hypothetical protein